MSKNSNWFNQCRYGMFIHWGAYTVGGRGEWIMNREMIPKEEYHRHYVEQWKAERYDPKIWTDLARKSGMGYMVLTSRHHDGFALWDSEVNPWNARRYGPKRDLVKPYVEACRAAGLRVGLYYSPAAWAHENYPGPFYRDWPRENDWKDEASRQSFIQFYRGEIKELLTRYGKIDYLWFDGCIPENLDSKETLAMIRQLQPEILVNNRLGEPFDVMCCERRIRAAALGQDWEACMTLNDAWAYHAGDHHWKDAGSVANMILTCAEGAGNLLLNIGPYADGTVPEPSVKILEEAGEWLNRNRECVVGSERHSFSWGAPTPITAKGNKVYLHFRVGPGKTLCWAETRSKVLSAKLMYDQSNLEFEQKGNRLFIYHLPDPLPDPVMNTIVLEFASKPEAVPADRTF